MDPTHRPPAEQNGHEAPPTPAAVPLPPPPLADSPGPTAVPPPPAPPAVSPVPPPAPPVASTPARLDQPVLPTETLYQPAFQPAHQPAQAQPPHQPAFQPAYQPAHQPAYQPAQQQAYQPPYQPPGPDQPPVRRRRWYRKPATWIGAGVGAVLLVGAAVLFLLYRPAFEVTAIRAPQPVVAGSDVTVGVRVENTGWGTGEHELTLLIEEQPAASATVTVPGGGDLWVDLVVRDLDAGRYTATVADFEELNAAVWVMTPPEFVIDSITLAPSTLDINTSSETTLLVRVSNVGEADGEHDLELIVDGVPTDSRTVALSGGTVGEESFGVTVASPGLHEVRVGDAVATLRVNQLMRPDNGSVLVNQIGGGANELRIRNNDPDDLLVVLAAPGPGQPALLSVYVHANSSYTVKGLADGVYSTYYAFGADWCTFNNDFTRNASYGRFEEDASYESGWSYYTYYTLEMGGTGGEWAPTAEVSPGNFPAM